MTEQQHKRADELVVLKKDAELAQLQAKEALAQIIQPGTLNLSMTIEVMQPNSESSAWNNKKMLTIRGDEKNQTVIDILQRALRDVLAETTQALDDIEKEYKSL